MNWKDFKDFLESQGVKDDMEILWMDFSYPDNDSPGSSIHVSIQGDSFTVS